MRFFALAALVLFCGVTGCSHRTPAPAATHAPATPEPIAIGNQGHGADIFRANCAICHTANGAAAGVGPSLTGEKKRKNYEQTVTWIENPDPPMPKLSLSEHDVADVAAYVQSL
jgi:mono/diheme cytochrome c family protein